MLQHPIFNRLRPHLRAPVIGATFAALMVLSPVILGGHFFLLFFSLGGLVIVVGGVITTAFMSYDAVEVRKSLLAVRNLFKNVKPASDDLSNDVTMMIYCARIVLEKGMRDLETTIGKAGIRDPFIRYGLNMVVSEYAPDEVRTMMETAADAQHEREYVPVEILQAMGSHAPAFGMVGTLVGMVAMLCSLTDNIAGIGPSLAVAFLSTLYGVLSARMVYMPAAAHLRREVDQHRFRSHLITEGMAMLVGKKTPMYVQDHLNSFLRPETHNYVNSIKPAKPSRAAPQLVVAA